MRARPRGPGEWTLAVFGAVLTLIGAVLTAGGGWLAVLGGSFYYLLAGLGLIVSGILLVLQRRAILASSRLRMTVRRFSPLRSPCPPREHSIAIDCVSAGGVQCCGRLIAHRSQN